MRNFRLESRFLSEILNEQLPNAYPGPCRYTNLLGKSSYCVTQPHDGSVITNIFFFFVCGLFYDVVRIWDDTEPTEKNCSNIYFPI
jgi:hypothetical protein